MAQQPERGLVTVATWNLWWHFGDWQNRFERIRAVLAEVRPDVVGLQEVWATADENAVEVLAEAMGLEWTWAASPCPDPWRLRLGADPDEPNIGNAILSRWPIAWSKAVDLPSGASGDRGRTALATMIDAPGGRLPFITTQLASPPAESATRVDQVVRLAHLVRDCALATHPPAAYPPVVTGDFNAVAQSDEMRLLEGHLTAPAVPGQVLVDVWRYAPAGDPGHTWDRENPNVEVTGEPSARIDYILVGLPTRQAGWRVVEVGRFGTAPAAGTWPSDHAGVYTRLAAHSQPFRA